MSASALVLRAAQPTDLHNIEHLLLDLGYAHPASEGERLAEVFRAILNDQRRHTWIAEVDGTVRGMMTLSTSPQLRLAGLQVTIEELVVQDGDRGRGVGTALVARAQEYAREVKAKRLELHTNRTRPVYERGFYVKRGFAEVNSAVMRFDLNA